MKTYIADTTTNPPRRTAVNVSDREWDMFPSWSPDGRHLAFVVAPPIPRIDADLRLVIRDMRSGEDRAVLRWQGSAACGLPQCGGGAWTADGTGYVLSRRIGPGTFGPAAFQIDRVDVATGAVQSLLPRQEASVAFPRLTPDGRHLYFVAGGSRLVRVDLVTNEQAEVASIAHYYDLSRDGSHLAYVQTESSAPVVKVQPVGGGPARVVTRFPPQEQINSVAFDATAESLFLAKTGQGGSEIVRVAVTGQANVVALGLFVMSSPAIAVHPDGHRLAFIDNLWSVDFWQMRGLAEAFAAANRATPSSAGPAMK